MYRCVYLHRRVPKPPGIFDQELRGRNPDRDFDQELRGPGNGKEITWNYVPGERELWALPIGNCADPRKE